MKILLCLLSGQHVPNLLSVHHYRPDRLVLIETEQMRKNGVAGNFRDALKIGGLDFASDQCCSVHALESEDDLEVIRRCLMNAHERYPGGEWIVNLSGGTKPMSIATYEFFKDGGNRLVYVNFQNPSVMLGMEGRTEETCDYRPTIREFLAGYGFQSAKSRVKMKEGEDRARSFFKCARRLGATCSERLLHFGDVNDPAVKKNWDKARNSGLDLVFGQLDPPDGELRGLLAETFNLREEPRGLLGRLDEYAVEFLTGGWLETLFWGTLDRHSTALGIWDVRLGIHPRKVGSQVDCEFDVAFMHGYRLSVIECKSGAQEHDLKTEALHKLEAVVGQFRALGIRSCLATTSPNVLGPGGQLKANIRDRASIYNCRILIRDQIRELAEKADDVETVRRLILGGPARQ